MFGFFVYDRIIFRKGSLIRGFYGEKKGGNFLENRKFFVEIY